MIKEPFYRDCRMEFQRKNLKRYARTMDIFFYRSTNKPLPQGSIFQTALIQKLHSGLNVIKILFSFPLVFGGKSLVVLLLKIDFHKTHSLIVWLRSASTHSYRIYDHKSHSWYPINCNNKRLTKTNTDFSLFFDERVYRGFFFVRATSSV